MVGWMFGAAKQPAQTLPHGVGSPVYGRHCDLYLLQDAYSFNDVTV